MDRFNEYDVYLTLGRDDFSYYVEAYRLACINLIKHAKFDDEIKNYMALPIMFLFRQYVELHAKAIIFKCNELNNNKSMKNIKGHNLKILLEHLIREVEQYYLSKNLLGSSSGWQNQVIDVTHEIDYLNKLDNNSQCFRYPINLDGSFHFSQESIESYKANLLNIQKRIDTVYKILKTWESGLYVIPDS